MLRGSTTRLDSNFDFTSSLRWNARRDKKIGSANYKSPGEWFTNGYKAANAATCSYKCCNWTLVVGNHPSQRGTFLRATNLTERTGPIICDIMTLPLFHGCRWWLCRKVRFCRVVIDAFDAIRLGKELFLHAFVRYIFVFGEAHIIGVHTFRIPSRRKITHLSGWDDNKKRKEGII